jgi:hypothetical protein
MADPQNNEEYYDGGDPDFDFNELNKAQIITNARINTISGIETPTIDPTKAFTSLSTKYDKPSTSQTDLNLSTTSTQIEDNPISKFNRIKSEIDQIEKDIQFYQSHQDQFKSSVSIEQTITELQQLKSIANYISSSDNFKTLSKIISSSSSSKHPSHLKSLNKALYNKLNDHLITRIQLINKLKTENPNMFDNNSIEYELYLAPDTVKVKQYMKIIELKQTLDKIEKKIGDWNSDANKRTISTAVSTVKNLLRFSDTEFKNEITEKMKALGERLGEIKNGNEDFYAKVNKTKLDELYNGFNSSKEVEELIYNTINKMESLKNNHEQSAFISLKLKELIDQQEKLAKCMDDNKKILLSLKENIKGNVDVMKKNIEVINNKLK